MKKVLKISSLLVLFLGIFSLLGFISMEKSTLKCKGLEVSIDRSDNNYFILEEEIKELFFNLGYGAKGQLLNSIDIRKIEQQVYNNPAALKADVYSTIDGVVKIDIKQRKPVLRVFNESGESFYIDEDGLLMPLSSKFTSRVLVANGFIEESYSGNYKKNLKTGSAGDTIKTILNDLFFLTKFINENEFWRAQITQLYVNSENEIELIPRVGSHTILFGDINEMEEKFEKLMIFYKKGLKIVGWNNYSEINLKFKNQVVCKKIQ